ncbi:MAG TPA: winged helix DNA-binding domain-containing protein [Polyangia bacterium]|nr:winged helix DNA-binding domain-containing protein [Polyangia bacterium]
MKALLAQRLAAQALTRPVDSVLEVARRLGALQAQDFAQAQWALGVRCEGSTLDDVNQAFADRQIVRSWAMRGTLHVVAAEDVSWLVGLCAKRNLARAARRLRELHIDKQDLAAARRVLEKVLPGQPMKRDEVFTHLERAGQAVKKQRGVYLLWHLAQDGVVALAGEHFVLLDEWVRRPRRLEGDEALGELARRYFQGHGPASLDDLAFWSGLPKGEAKRAQEIAGPAPEPDEAGVPEALLLPGFDEYFLGYAERSVCLEPQYFDRIVPGGNGVFLAMVVLRGQIRGTWRRRITRSGVTITVDPFEPLAPAQRKAVERAAVDYGTFHGKPVEVTFTDA